MRRLLTGLRTAFAALTVLPMGAFEPDPPAAVPWYPWVGWLYSALGVGIAAVASLAIDGPIGSLLVGVTVVTVWAGLSGLMHWDGLADTADGLLGGHTPERRLEIMADSATGAFGTVAVTLTLLVQVVAVAAVFASRDWWALAAAPVAGRLAASLCVLTRDPARAVGLGASAGRRLSLPALAFALLALGVAQLGTLVPGLSGFGLEHAVLVVVAVAVALTASWSLTRPIGGYTGDILGACIVYTETAVMFVAAAWSASSGGWPL